MAENYYEIRNPDLQPEPPKQFSFPAPSGLNRNRGQQIAKVLGEDMGTDRFDLLHIRSLANAVTKAFGGDFGPLQAWVADTAEDVQEGLFPWLDDLQDWAAGLDASKLIGQVLDTVIPNLDASKIVSGILNVLRVPDLSASKIVSGVLDLLRVPDLSASKITTGIFDLLRVPDLSASKIVSGAFDILRIPNLAASKITSGTFLDTLIPTLAASKITSGLFDILRVPDLSAAKIVSGVFDLLRVPDLDASKIASGTLPTARVPSLDASKITSGAFDQSRVSNLVDDLMAKASQGVVQQIIDLGVEGASGDVLSNQTPQDLRDALAGLAVKADTAEYTAGVANATLAQLLAEQNANNSGGISQSFTFNGPNDTSLDPTFWKQWLGNTATAGYVKTDGTGKTKQVTGTNDGTYRSHAMFATSYTSDDQSVAMVLPTVQGTTYTNDTFAFLRANDDLTAFTYMRIDGDTNIYIGNGTRSNTTWSLNDWTSIPTPSFSGTLVEFRVNGDFFEVLLNNSPVIQWTQANSPKGKTLRRTAFALTYSRAAFVNYFSPNISSFSMSDYAGSGFRGMGWNIYRGNSANANSITLGSGTGQFTGNVFDIIEKSTNIQTVDMYAGGVKIPKSGWWLIEASALSSAAIATGTRLQMAIYAGLDEYSAPLVLRGSQDPGINVAGVQTWKTKDVLYLEKDTWVLPGILRTTGSTGTFIPRGGAENEMAFKGVFING